MKIDVLLMDHKICTLDADMDLKAAIQIGEGMSVEDFNIIFAQSVLSEIMKQRANNDEGMTILYEAIAGLASEKYEEYCKAKKKKDSQKLFDKFFEQFLITDVKFIPLIHT